MLASPARLEATRRARGAVPRAVIVRLAWLALVLALAAFASSSEDWEPIALVAVLGTTLVGADVATVSVRSIRLSPGLMVQTTIMALLGPGPAVALGVLSTIVESRVNAVRAELALNNLTVFATLGLVGALAFELVRTSFELGRHDTAYALSVLPVYALLAALNLPLVVIGTPGPAANRWRVVRESGVPTLPMAMLEGLLAATTVLVWAHAGIAAAAALLLLVVTTIFMARTVAEALQSGDDLVALREVSDQRAAEVARLASDRERLLTEVLQAEERERARLAESLHDGPMQRLAALRQDAAEARSATLAGGLDEAIADTRAIISALHPATVRELGFEATLRAAMAPFPAARSVRLTVVSAIDDRAIAETVMLPVAQELVVNALKHARPTAIDVLVMAEDGQIALEVNDDGVGIDAMRSGRAVKAGHVGLAMVRRRVEDAGGRLDIATRSDGGTRSRVVLPETKTAPA